MPKLIYLGASSAVPTPEHENTHMAIVGASRLALVDTGHNPLLRLPQAGLAPLEVSDLILTHFHPDHVSGVASLLMNSWLMGRTAGLNVYGLEITLERTLKMMEYYDWDTWPHFYAVNFKVLPAEEMTPVLDCADFSIFASPVHHMVPNIGLRVEFKASGKVWAYSCDTEPCSEVVRLGRGADVLVHEVAGAGLGHTSARQAGEIALEAGARELHLIHYPTWNFDPAPLAAEAARIFSGPVALAEDFMSLDY